MRVSKMINLIVNTNWRSAKQVQAMSALLVPEFEKSDHRVAVLFKLMATEESLKAYSNKPFKVLPGGTAHKMVMRYSRTGVILPEHLRVAIMKQVKLPEEQQK